MLKSQKFSNKSNFFLFPIGFFIIASMAILKYLSLHSSFFDLGIFDRLSYIFSKNIRYPLLFYVHSHVFFILYGFLYKFIASPILLITCQILAITLAGLFITHQGPKEVEQNSNRAQITDYRLQTILIILYLLYFPV